MISHEASTYINEFGFFFFLRIAVAVSSFCELSVSGSSLFDFIIWWRWHLTSLISRPEGSL